MNIVKPTIVNSSILTSSNVPEDDYQMWTTGITYEIGERVIYNHTIYQTIDGVASQTIPPDQLPEEWANLGPTNRYKMFDQVVGSLTTNPMTVDVTLTPGYPITALVLFNVNAVSVRVIGESLDTGVFYDKTIGLTDFTNIVDWFQYFYAPLGERIDSEIAFLDIPPIGGGIYRIIIDNGVEDAEVGELVIGQQTKLGYINYGTSVGIISYSKKEVDQFGNFTIVPRRFASRANYDITIETNMVNFVKKKLTEVRDTPVVYIGNPDNPETIVYGFFRNFDIVLQTPTKSACSLDVEGLT